MKATVGFGLVFACTPCVVQAQDSLATRVDQVFATRVDTVAVKRGSRLHGLEPARVVLDAPAEDRKEGDCAPVDHDKVRELIATISAEEGMDSGLADAVANVESNSGENPGLSSAGAAGVMQLMPGTASDLGVADRCDAEANIRGGIRYLKQLLDEFEDPILALSAYNAGSGNVYKAGGIPLNNETVKYIAKVLNRWKYASLLPSSKSRDGRKTVTNGQPVSQEQDDADTLWRDGHVIDFN